MNPLERILGVLRGKGLRVADRPRRGGRWKCQCPAHQDDSESLDVMEGRDGQVIFKCFGPGCSAEQITRALGLTMKDLYPEQEAGAKKGRRPSGTRTKKKGEAAVSDRVLPEVPLAVREYLTTPKPKGPDGVELKPVLDLRKPTKKETYTDEGGNPLILSERFETRVFEVRSVAAGAAAADPPFEVGQKREIVLSDGSTKRYKTFKQSGFAPNGWKRRQIEAGWYELDGKVWVLQSTDPEAPPSGSAQWFEQTRRVLFGLPKLRAAAETGTATVWLNEGEKDVRTLQKLGLVATCNPMGANKWEPSYSMQLEGFAAAVIWCDRDLAGYRHALLVKQNIVHIISDVRIVEGVAGNDATDHIDAGFGPEDVVTLSEEDVLARIEFLSSLPAPLPGTNRAESSEASPSDASLEGRAGPSGGQNGGSGGGDGPPAENFDLSPPGGSGGPKWQERNSFPFTDVGNAERLANFFDGDVLYCHAQERWFVWDGIRYQPDIDGGARVTQGIYDMSRRICEGLSGKDKRGLAHFKKLESASGISATTAVLKHIPGIAVRTDDLDTRLDIIPCLNGVIDLRTGELMAGQKSMLCTRQIRVNFVKDAECPRWIEFLDMVLPDEESQRFLWQWFGYTLTGYISEQMMLFIYGIAGSGKSTVVDTLSYLMDEYYETIHRKHIMAKKFENDEIPQWLAKLKGCRYVTAVETQDHDRIDASMIKQMTGEKQITARFMAKNDFKFQPQFKLVVTGNFRFGIEGDDIGVWRRIADLTFENPIPEDKKVLDFSDKVWQEEKEGILQWALAGAQSWFKNGLTMGPKMKARVAEYRGEQDVLGMFIVERLEVIEGAQCTGADLYEAFRNWAKTNREYEMSNTKFGTKMKAKFESRRQGRAVMYFGVRIAPETVGMEASLV